MESDESSVAAISAIKALRKRLRDLEAENFELKREKKRQLELKKLRDQRFDDRKEKLKEKTEYAKRMLKTASVATSQISVVRRELEEIKQKSQMAENLLASEKKKNAQLEEKIESLKSDFNANSQRLSAYETFLGEFLSPPQQPTAMNLNQYAVLSADECNAEELDGDLAELVARLDSYPKKFKVQNLDTKKKILKDLCESNNVANNLCDTIKYGELRLSANKRMSKEVTKLYKQFFVITNKMKEFNF